jgi:TonB family protein
MRCFVLVAFVSAALVGSSVAKIRQQSQEDSQWATTSEATLRKVVVKAVMPSYPTSSRKRGSTGVAVAEIDLDENGNVIAARVLEAPDEEIGRSVVKSVQQWKFQPLKVQGGAVRIHSKLTFYFVAQKGRAWVEHPRRFAK